MLCNKFITLQVEEFLMAEQLKTNSQLPEPLEPVRIEEIMNDLKVIINNTLYFTNISIILGN